jgi:pyruvate formate lyase activating enzyme
MEFLRQMVTACNRLGIDTAVETCGEFDWQQGKDIIALLDCVFVDCKQMDDNVHRRMTGVGNRRILENITRISRLNANTIVRVPVIEAVNASEQNIRTLCEYLKHNTQVGKLELLPYHDFGAAKYSAVGAGSQSFAAPDAAAMAALNQLVVGYGLNVVDFK